MSTAEFYARPGANLRLFNGDCFAVMDELYQSGEMFDIVLCDMPYGISDCKWDVVLPLPKVWDSIHKLLDKNGVVLLFGTEPFSSILRTSNLTEYRYDWIWDKGRGTNFANAKKCPMQSTENISVFFRKKERPEYYPQYWYSKPYKVTASKRKIHREIVAGINSTIQKNRPETISEDGRRYPKNIIRINREFQRIHPTQKPVELLSYLIRTYQVSGRTTRILDFCAGSCSTGVASLQIPGVSCVLIEKELEYCESGAQRLQSVIL